MYEHDMTAIRRVYSDLAQGKTEEAFSELYDAFGTRCGLRPPADELRLAARISSPAKASA